MKIDEIENGIVFDHITAGKGMQVYNTLHLDKLKCQVAIIQNAKSEKMGAKDIIKINELIDTYQPHFYQRRKIRQRDE